jgi:hypothetical protein
MTPSRITNKLRGECSYHTTIRVVLSTKKLSNILRKKPDHIHTLPEGRYRSTYSNAIVRTNLKSVWAGRDKRSREMSSGRTNGRVEAWGPYTSSGHTEEIRPKHIGFSLQDNSTNDFWSSLFVTCETIVLKSYLSIL